MIIALCNFKSSVGKTTTAINLAAAMIEQGHTVRLWDLDDEQKDLDLTCKEVGLACEAVHVMSLVGRIKANPADYHIIECPPRKDKYAIVVQALKSADLVISPAVAEYYMHRGLVRARRAIVEAQQQNPQLEWRVFISKYLPRHKAERDELLGDERLKTFKTVVTDSAWLSEAPKKRKTAIELAPRSHAARQHRNLLKEIQAWQKSKN